MYFKTQTSKHIGSEGKKKKKEKENNQPNKQTKTKPLADIEGV